MAACSGHSNPPDAARERRAATWRRRSRRSRTTKVDAIAASIEFVRAQRARSASTRTPRSACCASDVSADGIDHVRLQQTYDGVKVWGSDIVVHSDGENVTGVDGTLLGALDGLDLAPVARRHDGDDHRQERLPARARATTPGGALRRASRASWSVLPVEGRAGAPGLARHLRHRRQRRAGRHLELLHRRPRRLDRCRSFNNLQTAVVEASGPGGNTRVRPHLEHEPRRHAVGHQLRDEHVAVRDEERQDRPGLHRHVARATTTTGDPGANDAHGFAEITIKMLKDWQGYNSIDNKGLVLVSNVHAGSQLGTDDNAGVGRLVDELRRRRRHRSSSSSPARSTSSPTRSTTASRSTTPT